MIVQDHFIYNDNRNIIALQLKNANNLPIDLTNLTIEMRLSKDPFATSLLTLTNEITKVDAVNGKISIDFVPVLDININQSPIKYTIISTLNDIETILAKGKIYVREGIAS